MKFVGVPRGVVYRHSDRFLLLNLDLVPELFLHFWIETAGTPNPAKAARIKGTAILDAEVVSWRTARTRFAGKMSFNTRAAKFFLDFGTRHSFLRCHSDCADVPIQRRGRYSQRGPSFPPTALFFFCGLETGVLRKRYALFHSRMGSCFDHLNNISGFGIDPSDG